MDNLNLTLNRMKFWKRGDYRCWMCDASYSKEQAKEYLWHIQECEIVDYIRKTPITPEKIRMIGYVRENFRQSMGQ